MLWIDHCNYRCNIHPGVGCVVVVVILRPWQQCHGRTGIPNIRCGSWDRPVPNTDINTYRCTRRTWILWSWWCCGSSSVARLKCCYCYCGCGRRSMGDLAPHWNTTGPRPTSLYRWHCYAVGDYWMMTWHSI